ncbi:DNA alkylation repair protein [archaeon]|jgi:3-methyladenine DNA glycosylase AlkD|nr:DNA alkylation repair protein [archaeon]MBT3730500.1 DNA alkylation repair protein [archaeon]MBT4669434.1 DNA alkylation repair protein [archaeon]MBT5029813.1 DNA alkylation repair protein [archaeon]MBT5288026.1 DNA alkylation repair protein [archaeon]
MQIIKDLKEVADEKLAKNYARFFKTGKGEYGEGDKFLGMRVGTIRKIAKKHKEISFDDLEKLFEGEYHEYRLAAIFILKHKYKEDPKKVVEMYLKNLKYVNNWDLVDLSAPKILGRWLLDKDRKILYKLAKSKDLWEKRVAILSCFTFIREKDYDDALKISEILLNDSHDLIHKAVGWMLREIGNRDLGVEEKFLKKYYNQMPRTMLRYAIEKFEESKRLDYLKGRI